MAVELTGGRRPAAFPEEGFDWKDYPPAGTVGHEGRAKVCPGGLCRGDFLLSVAAGFAGGRDRRSIPTPLWKAIGSFRTPIGAWGIRLVDMGADEFTAGRPHPMIDSSLRRERISAEAQRPGGRRPASGLYPGIHCLFGPRRRAGRGNRRGQDQGQERGGTSASSPRSAAPRKTLRTWWGKSGCSGRPAPLSFPAVPWRPGSPPN